MDRLVLLCALLWGCGFERAGAGDLAMGSDGGAPAPVPDGACGAFAHADLETSCALPPQGSCFDVLLCHDSCNDQPCADDCLASARNLRSRGLASDYLDCRLSAAAPSECAAACQDPSDEGLLRCIACLHVCSYDDACRMGCQCGACAGQFAACLNDT